MKNIVTLLCVLTVSCSTHEPIHYRVEWVGDKNSIFRWHYVEPKDIDKFFELQRKNQAGTIVGPIDTRKQEWQNWYK